MSFITFYLARYLTEQDMSDTLGHAPHPQNQAKIERWHRSFNGQSPQENYGFLTELAAYWGNLGLAEICPN
jgi:hypothetical protein